MLAYRVNKGTVKTTTFVWNDTKMAKTITLTLSVHILLLSQKVVSSSVTFLQRQNKNILDSHFTGIVWVYLKSCHNSRRDIGDVQMSELNPELVVFIQQHFSLFGIPNASCLITTQEQNTDKTKDNMQEKRNRNIPQWTWTYEYMSFWISSKS